MVARPSPARATPMTALLGCGAAYRPDYYGAFIRDADGNSIEAVHHERATAETGVIDHLWIRVANLSATRRFYSDDRASSRSRDAR